jgi:hypothetical protein
MAYIKQYKENWESCIDKMDRGNYPEAILNYRPRGRRSTDRPMKSWTEKLRP